MYTSLVRCLKKSQEKTLDLQVPGNMCDLLPDMTSILPFTPMFVHVILFFLNRIPQVA